MSGSMASLAKSQVIRRPLGRVGRVNYRDGKGLNTEFLKGDWILVTKTLEYGRQAVAAKQLSSFIYLETDESNGVKARFSKIRFS